MIINNNHSSNYIIIIIIIIIIMLPRSSCCPHFSYQQNSRQIQLFFAKAITCYCITTTMLHEPPPTLRLISERNLSEKLPQKNHNQNDNFKYFCEYFTTTSSTSITTTTIQQNDIHIYDRITTTYRRRRIQLSLDLL